MVVQKNYELRLLAPIHPHRALCLRQLIFLYYSRIALLASTCSTFIVLSFIKQHGGVRHGLGGLAPKVKNWRSELCEIFKFWSFLQSKSVNNVCKLLQLMETPLPGLRPWIPLHGGPPTPRHPGLQPPNENSCMAPPLTISENSVIDKPVVYAYSSEISLSRDPQNDEHLSGVLDHEINIIAYRLHIYRPYAAGFCACCYYRLAEERSLN